MSEVIYNNMTSLLLDLGWQSLRKLLTAMSVILGPLIGSGSSSCCCSIVLSNINIDTKRTPPEVELRMLEQWPPKRLGGRQPRRVLPPAEGSRLMWHHRTSWWCQCEKSATCQTKTKNVVIVVTLIVANVLKILKDKIQSHVQKQSQSTFFKGSS